jgi:hypothetical protein
VLDRKDGHAVQTPTVFIRPKTSDCCANRATKTATVKAVCRPGRGVCGHRGSGTKM